MLNSISKQRGINATIFSIVTFVSLYAVTCLVPVKNDYSGTWKINIQKSEFGEAPFYIAPKQLKVTQYLDSITIERVTTEDKVYTETLLFNGQVTQSVTPSKRLKSATIQWSDDGKGFTEPASYSAENNNTEEQYKLTEAWQLSEDGKGLSVDMVFVVTNGPKYSVKVYYAKQ